MTKHYCYLVITSKNTLYCGYTTNIDKRVATHNAGRGAKYTKKRLPVQLVYSEEFATKIEAMQREYAIKQLSRDEKLKLINDKTKT